MHSFAWASTVLGKATNFLSQTKKGKLEGPQSWPKIQELINGWPSPSDLHPPVPSNTLHTASVWASKQSINATNEYLQCPSSGTKCLQSKLMLSSLCAFWTCILLIHSPHLRIFSTQRASEARASCERGLQQQSVTQQSLTRTLSSSSQFPPPGRVPAVSQQHGFQPSCFLGKKHPWPLEATINWWIYWYRETVCCSRKTLIGEAWVPHLPLPLPKCVFWGSHLISLPYLWNEYAYL